MYWNADELKISKINVNPNFFPGKGLHNLLPKKQSKAKKLYNWKPAKDHLWMQFFRESTLHGLKYIGRQEVHTFERIFWTIAVICLACTAGIWILNTYLKYVANPVMVSFQPFEIGLNQIPFPAVTFCNINNIRKSEFQKIDQRYRSAPEGSDEANFTLEALNYLKSICDSASTFSTQHGFDKEEIKSEDGKKFVNVGRNFISQNASDIVEPALQSCEDMIIHCTWRNNPTECKSLFHRIFTDFGYCCVFNSMPLQLLAKDISDFRKHNISESALKKWEKWNIDRNILETKHIIGPPKHQRKAGTKAALTVLLNPELDDYFCASYSSQGFLVVTDSPIDYPLVKDFGKGILPDTETFVDVRPELTMVDPNIYHLSVESRHCYFNNEYKLTYYNFYTIKNCHQECISHLTFDECKCAAYNMPRNTSMKICFEEEYECVHRVHTKVTVFGLKHLCKHCLPGCTQIRYDMSISALPISSPGIWKKHGKDLASWASKNVSVVHVFFGTDSVYSRVRQLLFDGSDFLANFGGILGLFLGFSFVSLLEIVYHFGIKLLWEIPAWRAGNQT